MKLPFSVLVLLLTAGAALADTTTVMSRDSLFAKYMKRGAWQQPLFSQERLALTDSALKYLPQDAYLWQQRGMPLAKQRKYELAMRYTDSAVKYDQHRWLGYRAFMKCIFQKDHEGALDDLRLVESMRPDAEEMDHPFEFWMGLCHLQLSQYDSAAMMLQYCFDRDRKLGDDWLHHLHALYYGIALYEQRKFIEAIKVLDLSLTRYPDFADAKYYKALSLLGLKRKHEAVALLKQSKSDLAASRTINEDNSIYEKYPYQITEWMIEGQLKYIDLD